MPKLLIKDHKKQNKEGEYPTRLIVAATNFTAAFSKLGYLGIKSIFEKINIVFDKLMIIQASDLKNELEKLGLKEATITIFSLDAVDMYPLIKYHLVEKAIKYYARNLLPGTREVIRNCLQLVKFGMGATLLTFVDKYYKYGG